MIETMGEEHVQTLTVMINYAGVLLRTAELDMTLVLIKRLAEVTSRTLGTERKWLLLYWLLLAPRCRMLVCCV